MSMPKETAQRAKKSEAAAGWISRAIMVSFIGDAFGLGLHRYYGLDEMRRVYGEWISGYTDLQPGRYHEGLSGIPERFIGGLRDAELLLSLSRQVARQATEN